MDLLTTFLHAALDKIDPPPAPKAPAPEPPESPWAIANAAAKKVSKAILDIEAWRRANPQAADELDSLALAYNDALEEAKPLVAGFPGETIGPFNVSKCAVKKGIEPSLLTDAVRARKGVLVLTVDVKVVDALVKCGEVDEADVAPARTETIGSPSVRGPKLLVVKP